MPRIQISEPGKTPQPYKVKLDREVIKIGRAANNDLKLTDPSTSSNHCIIRRVEGGYVLEDNKSTNGVKLDGQRFLKIDLNQDTEFELGDVEVDFSFSDEEYDVLAEEDTFESEQQPMLPPSQEEKEKKRAKREAAKKAEQKAAAKKKKAEEDDDIELEDEDDEEEEETPKKKPKVVKRKDSVRHSSSRASRMIEIEEEEEEDADDIELVEEEEGEEEEFFDDDDEAEEEEERKPRKKATRDSRPPRRAQRLAEKNKVSPVASILFVILCILGFVVGLCIKHYKEHGRFLLSDMFGEKPVLQQKEEDTKPTTPPEPPEDE